MEIAALVFTLIGLGIAYVVFRILKKTVKMAVRALIVLLLIIITLAGGMYLWTYGDAKSSKSSTTKTR